MEVLRMEERGVRRGKVSLTRYLESQEDQDMTRLLNFLELKRREESGVFVCFGMNEREGIYSSGEGNMNGRPFNEG